MKQFVRLGTALACGLVVVGAVLAQTRTDTRVTSTTTTIHKGTVVMGANVVLQEGPTVGRVEDFVITDGGCIDYVVVSYESKYVLVPWTVTTWSGDRAIRVNITRERFRDVPTFTRDQWPNLSDTQYIQRVRTAWGVSESRSGEGRKAGTCQNGAAVGFGGHVLSYFFPISKPLRGACQTLGPGRPGC